MNTSYLNPTYTDFYTLGADVFPYNGLDLVQNGVLGPLRFSTLLLCRVLKGIWHERAL